MCYPSPAQIALALLVLKSRPLDLSLEDYVVRLRRCVQAGNRASTHHLDSIAFWKGAYEKSEVAQNNLQTKQQDSQQIIEELRNELCQLKALDLKAGIKRMRSPSPTHDWSNVRKRVSTRVRRTPMPELNAPACEAGIVAEGLGDLDRVPTAFARAFFTLRQSLSAQALDEEALRKATRRMCATADEGLQSFINISFRFLRESKTAVTAAQSASDNLHNVIHTTRLCYPSLLQAVEKLSEGADEEENCIYDLTKLMQNILGHLHAIATLRSDTSISRNGLPEPEKSERAQQHSCVVINLDKSSAALSKLVVHFFEMLDLSKVSNIRLFEGIACVLLDYLGSSLSLVVFSNREDDRRAKCVDFLPPRGIVDTSGIDYSNAIRATEYEGPYLIFILRHLMSCIDNHESVPRFEKTLVFPRSDPSTSSVATFTTKVRNKFQNTLLRGVFGDDDSSFEEAFRKPIQHANIQDHAAASVVQEGGGEWLVEEVWSILGWDVLNEQYGAPS